MDSREITTAEYETIGASHYCTNRLLYQIAVSLGRIADMLAEMNGYTVDYSSKEREEE